MKECKLLPVNRVAVMQAGLMALACMFGGFYEYMACFAGVFLCLYFLTIIWKEGKVIIRIGYCSAAVFVMAAGYIISSFYAVDRGMALLGIVKFLTIPLFMLCCWQMTKQERMQVFHAIPYTGVLIVSLGTVGFAFGSLREYFFVSGRFGGTFQYSNTMALFLLLGIIVLHFMNLTKTKYLTILIVLYMGVLMTGSRAVFIVTVLTMIFLGIYTKSKWRCIMAVLTVSIAVGLVYVTVSGDFQNIGRFLTISPKSSTFLGRLLYWKDGVQILKNHPFGLGYEGYKYIQGHYQTGDYAIEFIHNDWLQIMLDIGIIPALFFISAVVKSFLSKKTVLLQKLCLVSIVVLGSFDFHMQFLTICFILILSMDLDDGKEYVVSKNRVGKIVAGTIGVLILCWCYIALPLLCFYGANHKAANELFPLYTEAKLELLKDCDSLAEAQRLADDILKRNRYTTLAYNAKALMAYAEQDYEQVVFYKRKAISNQPYSKVEYLDYFQMLSRCLENMETKKGDTWELCYNALLEIPELMKETEERTSSLGWRIKDRPDLEIPEDMQKYIKNWKK